MGGREALLHRPFYLSRVQPVNWIEHHHHNAPVNSRSPPPRARDHRGVVYVKHLTYIHRYIFILYIYIYIYVGIGDTGAWFDGKFDFSIIQPLNWIVHHRRRAPVNLWSLSPRNRDQRHRAPDNQHIHVGSCVYTVTWSCGVICIYDHLEVLSCAYI